MFSHIITKIMNAVNAVRLFILVCTFAAFCRADDGFSVNCEDVTGTVDEEVNFTCSVSIHSSGCCVYKYKFYPEKRNDSEICRREFPEGSCEKRNRFTCSFRSETEIMETFRFFVQTDCGHKLTGFTVNITETSNLETVTEDPETSFTTGESPGSTNLFTSFGNGNHTESSTEDLVPVSVASSFIIFLLVIVITMIIIYKKKPNYIKSSGFRRMFLRRRQEDDSNSP